MKPEFALPRYQHIILQQIASYFKVPYKKLRATVDQDKSQGENTLVVGLLEESDHQFDDRFYCSESKFKLSSVWNPVSFKKTQFYQDYLHYLQHRPSEEVKWACSLGGSSVILVTSYPGDPPTILRGESLIHIGHANDHGGISVVPLKTYLAAAYPYPSL